MSARPSIRMRPRREAGTTGFTLVELLVVIAMIALLTALLLPGLSKAKARGQSASCKSRLRQIGLSLAMYVSDHHRYPPMWGDDAGHFQTWSDRLYPYAPLNWTNRSWHCAAYTSKDGAIGVMKPRSGEVVLTSHAYNAYGIAGLEGSRKLGLGIWFPTSLATEPEVRVPGEMFAVGDARTYRDLFIWGVGNVSGLCGRIEMQPYYAQTEETSPHPRSVKYMSCAKNQIPISARPKAKVDGPTIRRVFAPRAVQSSSDAD